MKPFRVETTVDAPQALVWRHFTEPELIRQWFGWDHEGLSDEIQLIFLRDARLSPPDRIALGDDHLITLTAESPTSTTVRIESPGEPTGEYDAIEEGWRQFLEQLRFLLARGHGARRTLFFQGVVNPALRTDAGPVWHRSRHLRMTVDGSGHLVALATQASVDSTEPTDATVTVSTFGLDDAGFAAVEEAWADRWKSLS
ncbi:SRPBCC domain-containing protein [Asanoa sp. NPDC049573]|uniref:SRPBCC family protein n=1 Tax=Asanoa sp. NPDC049573 TaxID=3155396 RepID=UPI00341F4555